MSRNKNRKNDAVQIHLEGDTIREQFDNYFASHKKISDMIRFFHVVNATLLAKSNLGMSEEEEDDVVAFAHYFDDEFMPICYNAFIDEWGDLPYLFDLADSIEYERQLASYQEEYEKMSSFRRHEVDTLAQTLFEIREEREIYFETAQDSDTFNFPKTIAARYLENAKETMRKVCGHIVANNGIVKVTLEKPNKKEIFGIMVLQNGIWVPLEKEQMKKIMLSTASGIELEPEDDVVYTDIVRELI